MSIILANTAAAATILSAIPLIGKLKNGKKKKTAENLSNYKNEIHGLISQMEKEIKLPTQEVDRIINNESIQNLLRYLSKEIFDNRTVYELRRNPISSSTDVTGEHARAINDLLHEIESLLRDKKSLREQPDLYQYRLQIGANSIKYEIIVSNLNKIKSHYEQLA